MWFENMERPGKLPSEGSRKEKLWTECLIDVCNSVMISQVAAWSLNLPTPKLFFLIEWLLFREGLLAEAVFPIP
jgi:hypothetical protein